MIWIDMDGSAQTGHPRPVTGSSEVAGAELEIEFSPRPASRGVVPCSRNLNAATVRADLYSSLSTPKHE